MKRYVSFFTAALFLFSSASAVFAEECVPSENGTIPTVSTQDGSGRHSFTLYAGQTIYAGEVLAEVVDDNLEVTYSATGGWTLNEVHLWVGVNSGDMPQTRKGSPIPGQFPHVSGDISSDTSYKFILPLTSLGFTCSAGETLYKVAAHASMSKVNADGSVQSETGWSNGGRITERGNWATISDLTLFCDCETIEPPVTSSGSCETGFAYSPAPVGTCFLDIDEDGDNVGDFNRWGWSVGPLTAGIHDYVIYTGAGLCDTNKGTDVGILNVNYDGTTAIVTYQIDTDTPYSLKETQVYVGNEILPTFTKAGKENYTVAPGQYPQIQDVLAEGEQYSTFTFDLNDFEANSAIYIVAHATVCGFPEK